MRGSGAANNAAAQMEADALRDNPGTAARLDIRTWVWLAVACVPLVVVTVVAFLVS